MCGADAGCVATNYQSLQDLGQLPGALHGDDPELVHVPGEVLEAVVLRALDIHREVVDHFRRPELPQ